MRVAPLLNFYAADLRWHNFVR